MPTQTPTLAEVFDRAMTDRLKESFGGWLPARIEAYNSTTNRASIQILLYDDYEDEEGDRQIEPFPVLNDIPVGFLSLGGKFCLRSTVSRGDEGMALFPARPTGKWLNVGGMVDPADEGHHDFNGAVFLPYRLSAGGTNADPAIVISSTDIQIGGNKNLVTKEEFDGHTHGKGTIVCSNGTVTGTTAGAPAVAGTQKLKGG